MTTPDRKEPCWILVKYSLDGLTKHMAKCGYELKATSHIRESTGNNRLSVKCKLWAKYQLKTPHTATGTYRSSLSPSGDVINEQIRHDFAAGWALEIDAALMNKPRWWMKTTGPSGASTWYTCIDCMVTAYNTPMRIKHKTTCSRHKPSIQPLDRPDTESRNNW